LLLQLRAFFQIFNAARQRKKTEKSKKKDEGLKHATTLRARQGLPLASGLSYEAGALI
jgi:hypothetical protein